MSNYHQSALKESSLHQSCTEVVQQN